MALFKLISLQQVAWKFYACETQRINYGDGIDVETKWFIWTSDQLLWMWCRPVGSSECLITGFVQNVLPPNLVKPRSREIVCYDNHIALKFDRHLGRAAAEVPVKFQSDWKV